MTASNRVRLWWPCILCVENPAIFKIHPSLRDTWDKLILDNVTTKLSEIQLLRVICSLEHYSHMWEAIFSLLLLNKYVWKGSLYLLIMVTWFKNSASICGSVILDDGGLLLLKVTIRELTWSGWLLFLKRNKEEKGPDRKNPKLTPKIK